MKVVRVGMAVCAIWICLCMKAQAVVVDRVVAVVSGEVITLSELNTAFDPIQKRISASYKGPDMEKIVADARLSVLNRLINTKLIEMEAKKSGLALKDDEVMATVKDIQSKQNITLDQLKQNLAKEGLTFEDYKRELRDLLTRQRLIRREITVKITVNDEEIGDYYRKHREDYEGQEAVRVKQILLLFPKPMEEETKEKLRADANTVHGLLKSDKESFESLAVKYSKGPAAEAGGDIGFVEKGAMVSEVDQVAFRLGVGEVSGVIESPIGFHVIKVVDKKGAGIKPLAAVREEIRAKIEQDKMNKKFEEWIEVLRKKSLIEMKM